MATVAEMEEITLGCCGVTAWFPKDFLADKRKTGKPFYCPNGHERVYRETDADRPKKQLEAAKSELADKSRQIQDIRTGKCPWCWKTVKNLNAHIARRHK